VARTTTKVRSEDAPAYTSVDEQAVIRQALEILTKRVKKSTEAIGGPEGAKELLVLRLGESAREVFGVMFLSVRHTVLAIEDMFFGTIDACTIHPREVARRALELNASAIIMYHNHPSGDPNPSHADQALTRRITEALALLDIRTLDHIVVGGTSTVSFADRGWV
jgi:DNA repair protein RadC